MSKKEDLNFNDTEENKLNYEEHEDYEYEDYYDDYEYYNNEPIVEDVIYNILRNRIVDTAANAMFNENNNYCEIGEYSDMGGEEEIAHTLNSIDREILKEYFEDNPEDLNLFNAMREKYADILPLEEKINEKEKRLPNIEWYNNIIELNKDMEKFENIASNEKELYTNDGFEIKYNWDGIYYALTNKETTFPNVVVPKCDIPEEMKEMYEVDDQGNLTGNYNWTYIMDIIKEAREIDAHDIFNNKEIELDYDALLPFPDQVRYILENAHEPENLYESLIKGTHTKGYEADLNCPIELRENQDVMHSFFEMADDNQEILGCFELMGDGLKENKEFIESLFELDSMKKWGHEILSDINPNLYEKDDSFKTKMIECCGISVFEQLWDETSHLWDKTMESIDNQEFYEQYEEYFDFEDTETQNSVLLNKMREESEKRHREDNINNDKKVLSIMKKAVRDTIGKTEGIDKELNTSIEEKEHMGEEYGDN